MKFAHYKALRSLFLFNYWTESRMEEDSIELSVKYFDARGICAPPDGWARIARECSILGAGFGGSL
jgi:hypothetical protein